MTAGSESSSAASRAAGEHRFRAGLHVVGGRVPLGVGLGIGAVLVVIVGVNALRFETTWQWVATLGGLVAALAWAGSYIASAELIVTDDEVLKRRWWIWTTRLRRDQVYGLGAALRQPLERRLLPVLFVREHDEEGRGTGSRIKLSAWFWDTDDLRRIGRLLDIPVIDEAFDAAEFERRAPGVLSLRHRRPWFWAFGLVFGGLTVVFAVLLLVFWSSDGSETEDGSGAAAVSEQVLDEQDARLEDVVAALPARPWETTEEQYQRCRDTDRREGWRRTIGSVSEGNVEEQDVAALVSALTQAGLAIEEQDAGTTRTITGRSGEGRGAAAAEEITVLVEPSSLQVVLVSPCDVL